MHSLVIQEREIMSTVELLKEINRLAGENEKLENENKRLKKLNKSLTAQLYNKHQTGVE